MRFLQLKQIEEASQILTQLENEKPGLAFILEPYSCKSSKKQKKRYTAKSKDDYIINTLDLSFADYSFERNKPEDFRKIELMNSKVLVNEFMTVTNIGVSDGTTDLLFDIIDKAIDIKNTEISCYDLRDGPFEDCALFFCQIFYNKKKKRVILFSGMIEK